MVNQPTAPYSWIQRRNDFDHAPSKDHQGEPETRPTTQCKLDSIRVFSVRYANCELQTADLGPHAFEAEMPRWLRKLLEQGAKVTTCNRISADGSLVRYESIANETRGILPILSQLCEQDRSLSKVYLCHPDVQHVGKLAKEGGFCGYRNIQMMVSSCLV